MTEEEIGQFQNKSKWASILEAAFVKEYDPEEIRRQLHETGTPAIAIAFTIISGETAKAVRPDGVSRDQLVKLLKQLKETEIRTVSIKQSAELKVEPALTGGACYWIAGYDAGEKETVDLRSCKI